MKSKKGVIALPLVPLVLGIIAWAGNKAIPAAWKHHLTQPSKVQVEMSKDLCDKHSDCEAEKGWAMNGLPTPVPAPSTELKIQGDQVIEK